MPEYKFSFIFGISDPYISRYFLISCVNCVLTIAFGFCIKFSLSILSRKISLTQSEISGLESFDSIICIHQFSIRQLRNLFIVF